MGTPIKFEDIRKGDTIREEYDDGSVHGPEIRSVEYVAAMNKNTQNRLRASRWFLLDRPRKLIHEQGKTLWFRPNHTYNPSAQVRVTKDFHEGDCDVYVEVVSNDNGSASWGVGYRGGWLPSNFTDVRPRKVIHAKGTTLYLKHAHRDAKKGDPVTVLEDYFEDQHMVRAVQADGFKDGYPYEYWLTTEKPRVLKWAKGTRLWFKDDAENRASRCTGFLDANSDVYEGDQYVNLYYVSRFTDEKPEPHPVGAIRWVTEDCKSAHGYWFKKGDRVEVVDLRTSSFAFDKTVVVGPLTGASRTGKFINPKYLGATPVEPEPTIVAVPLPAIEKLRDAENWSAKEDAIHTRLGNANRRNAINIFLGTREVRTALDVRA